MMRSLLLLALLWSGAASAQRLTVHVGPPALGSGGSNPVSVPPVNPIDYEFVWLTKTDHEWSASILPGLFYGKRLWVGTNAGSRKGPYVSYGAGLLLNYQGVGPGVYSAFGLDQCGSSYCFNVEVKQALGLTGGRFTSAYALRVGMSFLF